MRVLLTISTRVLISSIVAAATVAFAIAPLTGQIATKPAAKAVKTFSTPKTPWGDPDLRGVYTDNDESGIPFERPAEFDGKRLEDVSEAQLNELRQERAEQAIERAPRSAVRLAFTTLCTGSRTSTPRTAAHG
jgi:hypothetical protein